MESLLTVQEVAEKFKIDETTVYKWKGRGILRAVRLSRKALRFREKDIQDFIESKLVCPKAHSYGIENQPFGCKKSSASDRSRSKSEIERLIEKAQREVLGNA